MEPTEGAGRCARGFGGLSCPLPSVSACRTGLGGVGGIGVSNVQIHPHTAGEARKRRVNCGEKTRTAACNHEKGAWEQGEGDNAEFLCPKLPGAFPWAIRCER